MSTPLLILSENETKTALITHSATQVEIPFYYREPTTRERLAVANAVVSGKGKTVKIDRATAQLRGGLTVLTGIGDGILGVKKSDGTVQPMSTNPDSEEYYPEWKELAKKHLGQELMLLGAFVFSGSTIVTGDDRDNEDDDILEGMDEEEASYMPSSGAESMEGNLSETSMP